MATDPMEERALALLREMYRENEEGLVLLENVAQAAGLIPQTRAYHEIVSYLEYRGAIEEATDLPQGFRSAAFYRITHAGMEMLGEEGPP